MLQCATLWAFCCGFVQLAKRPLTEEEFINTLARNPRTYAEDNDKFRVRRWVAVALAVGAFHCVIGRRRMSPCAPPGVSCGRG